MKSQQTLARISSQQSAAAARLRSDRQTFPPSALAARRTGPDFSQGQLGHDLRSIRVFPETPAITPHATAGLVQRKEAPKPTTFSGCTPDNTLTDKPNQELARALTFASDLVDAAIGAVGRNDKSEPYRTALARHFIDPPFNDLKDVFRNFRRIWFHLKPENFACAASDTELDECEKVTEGGFDLASTPTQTGIGVGPSVLCPAFWFDKLPCRAITLIHESAHAVGIGNGGTHPPNRGSADYPNLAAAPPAGQTAALRMNNPDAYAHFAAHIGRETDTPGCGTNAPELPISPRGAIKMEDPAPGPNKK